MLLPNAPPGDKDTYSKLLTQGIPNPLPPGINPVDYWSEKYDYAPWKEMGYGAAKKGIGAWMAADYPVPTSYPAYEGPPTTPTTPPTPGLPPTTPPTPPTPGLGDDVVVQPVPSQQGGDPNWIYNFDYGGVDPVDYWTERHGLHPWQELGFGQLGRGGFAAWEQAGMPIPRNYPGVGGGKDGKIPGAYYDFDYRGVDPVDYWTERHGLHPWYELGFGQLGKGGFAAWEAAGMPIPSSYPGATTGVPPSPDIPPRPDPIPPGPDPGWPTEPTWPSDYPPDYPTPGAIPPYPEPSPDFPADWASTLEKFGYTGPMGINPWEEESLKFIEEIYGTKLPLQTMMPATDLYSRMIQGEFAPDISGITGQTSEFYKNLMAGGAMPDIKAQVAPAEQLYTELATGEFAPDYGQLREPAEQFYRSLLGGEYGPSGGLHYDFDYGGEDPVDYWTEQHGLHPWLELGFGSIGEGGVAAWKEAGMPIPSTYPGVAAAPTAPGTPGATGDYWNQQVYQTTKAGAMQNLADLQSQIGETFAQRGGYFGGPHAQAQGLLAERTGTSLNELLANLNLTGYRENIANMLTAATGMRGLAGEELGESTQDITSRIMGGQGLADLSQLGLQAQQQGLASQLYGGEGLMNIANMGLGALGQDISTRLGAAGGLTGIAGQQQSVTDAILNNLLTGGQMITGREATNRAELQNAMQRAYADWMRARQETLMPFNLGTSLLGYQPQQPIVQQQQASPWGGLLSGIGTGVSAAGMAAILASSKEFKKDISEISEKDEDAIFAKIKETPIFNYRYKFEPETQDLHMGLITEHAPKEVTFFDNKMVGLYEYIATLHAAIKVLSRKIETLENGG